MSKTKKKRPQAKKSWEDRVSRHYERKVCGICHKSDVKVGKDGLCNHCRKNGGK